MNNEELTKEIQDLKKKVADLEEIIRKSQFLQEDYSKNQVFRRDVIFENPVYDRNGTKVIN